VTRGPRAVVGRRAPARLAGPRYDEP